jgi:hypothetical protein
MDDFIQKSGRVWLEAAVNKIPIPTWSGASRASFQKLATELGTTVTVGPRAASNWKDRTALGRSTSQGSRVISDQSKDFYGFVFQSDLRYLEYNEKHAASPGEPPQPMWKTIANTPYGFMELGNSAWKAYADKVRLPEPLKSKFLKKFKVV